MSRRGQLGANALEVLVVQDQGRRGQGGGDDWSGENRGGDATSRRGWLLRHGLADDRGRAPGGSARGRAHGDVGARCLHRSCHRNGPRGGAARGARQLRRGKGGGSARGLGTDGDGTARKIPRSHALRRCELRSLANMPGVMLSAAPLRAARSASRQAAPQSSSASLFASGRPLCARKRPAAKRSAKLSAPRSDASVGAVGTVSRETTTSPSSSEETGKFSWQEQWWPVAFVRCASPARAAPGGIRSCLEVGKPVFPIFRSHGRSRCQNALQRVFPPGLRGDRCMRSRTTAPPLASRSDLDTKLPTQITLLGQTMCACGDA